MIILDFNISHVEAAQQLALSNYKEVRQQIPILPEIEVLPSLEYFAQNGLGVATFQEGQMIGFLCCYEPWNNAFSSTAKGTFSPIHAHGAIAENRKKIYQKMYQAAAEKWIKQKITYHSIGLYAHDTECIGGFFTYGFGMRCVDAIRPIEVIECDKCEGVYYEELAKTDAFKIRKLRQMLAEHLGSSPCFMHSSPEDFQKWLIRAEERDSRLFVAIENDQLIAFVEVTKDGENFVTEVNTIANICGAFCLPEYRGRNIFQNLLNYTIMNLKEEGYKLLGVDYESFNSTANGFWLKYFTPYTNSVVRRIDECVLHD